MQLNKTKCVTLVFAICFAILQALQPFIHAHLDAEHPIQNTGFHVGDEHEEVMHHSVTGEHALSGVPHASHTISVASGIKKDIDPALVADPIAIVLFCLCIALVLQSVFTHFLPLAPVPYQSLKRRLPASRAPPQF
ncbi:MAG TPA: hypothetical protein VK967_00345 [Methylotenera sp.]|nr:hypothetical protein [Methylotenera sp.]